MRDLHCRLCAQGATLDTTDRIVDLTSPADANEPAGKKPAVDVTRYLAAAAYLDEDFRDDAIFQTLYQKHRFIAPSYGVNIGSVVRHCIASRRLSLRRDVILTALIIVGVWALHWPLLFSVAAFVGGILLAIALVSPKTKLRWKIFLSIVAYIAIVGFILHPLPFLAAVAALFVVMADTYDRRYRVVARHMSAKDFNADAPAYGRERPHERASDERRIAHLAGHEDGNVVAYSGFSPFKGSGLEVKRWSWSFAIDVSEVTDELATSNGAVSFETADVYAHVIEAMNNLDLEGCSAADRFYVSGKHVRTDEELFFHPRGPQERFPRLRSTIDEVSRLDAKPPEIVRR
ncbi:MAG: hypothetical protein ABR532_07850 [Candidatus Dormibacteria bacterium]